jgi:6-pyruvoyltetrahydropterin/6-carboxytetrahydropterin synthase
MKKPTIRITKMFKFETAHSLAGYDGLCKNIHGHSYELLVTVSGHPIEDTRHPKLGMVMDFGDLKKIVKEIIVEPMDHALVLRNDVPVSLVKELEKLYDKIILVDYQPTRALMLADFAKRIRAKLPANIRLRHLLLRETVTSYAEWFAEENQ